MARSTYHCRVLTLGKAQLGESDLIITALKEDGSLLRGVAKGARKPSNPFAARLEIFTICDCLIARGKSLDVFCEARVVDANLRSRSDYGLSNASYPIVQALSKTCHEGLEIPRLFDMARAALASLNSTRPETAPSITAAFLLKLFAMLGFRPSFMACVNCGRGIEPTLAGGVVSFSYRNGGYTCRDCTSALDTVPVEYATIAWSQTLMMSAFSDILDMHVDPRTSFAVLHLCHAWLRENLGLNLKSLNALLHE